MTELLANAEGGVVTMLLSAIGAMGSAFVFIARYVLKKLDDCEEDRATLWAALADRVGHGESPEQLREAYKQR